MFTIMMSISVAIRIAIGWDDFFVSSVFLFFTIALLIDSKYVFIFFFFFLDCLMIVLLNFSYYDISIQIMHNNKGTFQVGPPTRLKASPTLEIVFWRVITQLAAPAILFLLG
jgi:hypothetical protein